MRRYALGLLTVALAASGSVAAASVTVRPVAGKRFSGTGADYENDGPGGAWKKDAVGRFSFRTSRDATQLRGFRGTYSYYCGNGTATVTARYLIVSRSGRFDYRFPFREKYGTAYVEIKGAFQRGGRRATVSYLVDFVAKGQTVRHPYATSHPRTLGCASWVRGVAKVG